MEYIKNAEIGVHQAPQPPVKEVSLFGNKYKVYDHKWRTHLHVVCSYRCNAKCEFCIEKNSTCKENSETLIHNLSLLLEEMNKAGILHTVSITGGEPSIFRQLPTLIQIIKQYNVFLTINTNGYKLVDLLYSLQKCDFINISRHYIDDAANRKVFRIPVPSLNKIKEIRKVLNQTKIRIQAVVNKDTKLKDYLQIAKRGYVDDLSFRQLMLDGSQNSKDNVALYRSLVDEALNLGHLQEQEIQDYYVYETHIIDNIPVTFSYSNMLLLKKQEQTDSSNFIREFIIRPDGAISGSWFSSNIKKVQIK